MGKKSEGVKTVFEVIEIGKKLFGKKGRKK
jgi:hypothetical protein